MKKLLLLFVLFGQSAFGAFTEFYAQTTGSNLNAGSDVNDAAELTSSNGNWDSTTGVFICLGTPNLSGVTVGEWASIYTDGASVGVFVGRITAVVDATDTITVSLTAKSGTPPSTSATARTIKVGGAWKGPNAAENFPFGFVQSTMSNAAADVPRVNFKVGTYTVTAAVAHANAGPLRFQGYTSSPGDLGRATLTDSTTAASYVLFTLSVANVDIADFIFASAFSSGTSDGVSITGAECTFSRCVAHDFRAGGFNSTVATFFNECEAYLCGKANGAGVSGFTTTGFLINCVSHDNAGSNVIGFNIPAATAINCIADTNGKDGFRSSSSIGGTLINCDAYNNGGAGVDFTSTSAMTFTIQNCNLVKNGTWGINSSGSLVLRNGSIVNCGFGSGTQANTSGTVVTGLTGISEMGSVNYASDVTPWVDPANGDFRINLAAAKGTGRGTFTETQASYTGTIGYPDIGAAQHFENPQRSFTFGQ